jgi:hypothetical protein
MYKTCCTIGAGTILSAMLFLAPGCGGASEGAGFEELDLGDTPGAATTPASPKEQQAKAYCDNEVERATLQPPDILSRKQIQACLIGQMPQIRTCGKGVKREVVLKIVIDKSGEVANAFPVGDAADSPEAACVAEKVTGLKFPQFKATAQQVIEKYPFEIGE